MVDPTHIEFEDDIVLTIKTFLKKTQQVSPTLWTLFPLLAKVFEKSQYVFGNLLNTINYYMLYGREQLAQNRDHLALLVRIAHQSLYCTQPNIVI
jgi:hypothetical protein